MGADKPNSHWPEHGENKRTRQGRKRKERMEEEKGENDGEEVNRVRGEKRQKVGTRTNTGGCVDAHKVLVQ